MGEQLQKRLYDVKEAGKYLGRSAWAVRHLIWSGVLPEVRQGKRVMVDVVDMDEFIKKYKKEADHGNDLPEEEKRSDNRAVG